MKHLHIKKKLEALDVVVESIPLGDFDRIGEFTAKRDRKPDDPNYTKACAFYRANYERGILIYYLIRQFNLTSFLEIGFGRGYGTLCAAKAFHDSGVKGTVVSIEPNVDEKFVQALGQIFPKELFSHIKLIQGTSRNVLPSIQENFDLIYIDGDHSYDGTKFDWENTKDKFNKLLLFDDYHLPSKDDPGIQCNRLIDEIDWKAENCEEPELLIMDRRLFFDDRRLPDEQIDYGQVLLTRQGVSTREDW